MKKGFVIAFLLIVIGIPTYSQESGSADGSNDEAASVSLNVDIVSRYLWRGLPLCSNPSIQPYGSLDYKGLSFGAWASYGIATPFSEVDLFLSYATGNFTFTINDYFNEDETDYSVNKYFSWKNDETPHALEGMITYEGPESFPIALTAATFFYGNDKNADGDNLFSTYFEIGYNTAINEMPVKLFIGGTPTKGYYTYNEYSGVYKNGPAITNIGATISKSIKINDDFEIPVNGSFVVNPQREDAFFVIGITF